MEQVRRKLQRRHLRMLRKVERRFSAAARLVHKAVAKLKKKRCHRPSPPPHSPSPAVMAPPVVSPFIFPASRSSVLPLPSAFFAPHLSSPLPTNSFFQNFVLKNGDQPEYIHPYLVKSSGSSVSLCYPSRFASPLFIYQAFAADLTISGGCAGGKHVVSAFDDLSVTLDVPPALRFFLVRGSPFITCATTAGGGSEAVPISISTVHAIISVSSNPNQTKHVVLLNSGQTFLVYSSSPLRLTQTSASVLSAAGEGFSGVLRVAYLPNPTSEPILDRFSCCYPLSGKARFAGPYSLEYRWEKEGWGELLLLAHPLHLKLLQPGGGAAVLSDLRYGSIDGDLVGVVGDRWVLKTDPIPITFHSIGGVAEQGFPEIAAALHKDVGELSGKPIATTSSYFFGKAIARAARLALIAEEIGCHELIPAVRSFLAGEITPWLDGTFAGNGLRYDPVWGGVVSVQGLADAGADFGFGIYNDHHYHLGYFLYAMAVLSKLDPMWGRKHMPQGYAMAGDFMSFSGNSDSSYPRLRCFDLWKLHSWAGGLTEFADGRNQESTSEAVNGYYSAALLGMIYGDVELVDAGATLAALEVSAAATWWHVKEGEGIYEEEFCRENRVLGVLWSNKRDSGLWFAPPEWRECRLGIQVLPLLPITELLFGDVGFARELVRWASPALEREGVGEGWKGFVYALQGLYDAEGALEKTRRLNQFDDGNSLSNMLWWLYSRERGRGARWC